MSHMSSSTEQHPRHSKLEVTNRIHSEDEDEIVHIQDRGLKFIHHTKNTEVAWVDRESHIRDLHRGQVDQGNETSRLVPVNRLL